jgi:hypothetical protein
VSGVTLERDRAHAQMAGRQPDIDIGLHKQTPRGTRSARRKSF